MAGKSTGGAFPWFRLYTEARNDAKLRALTRPQHYVWFNLLCFAAEQRERGSIVGYDDELLAVEVADGDVELLLETIERLIKFHIIELTDDGLAFTHFIERQYDYDSDAPDATRERKRQQRERSRNLETVATRHESSDASHEMSRDVTNSHETDADADADVDAEGEVHPTSLSSEDQRRRQQHAHTRTHTRETADGIAVAEASPGNAGMRRGVNDDSGGDGDGAMAASHRLALTEFTRQFAEAAGLGLAERGQELDAIITAYRPRAPDADLIVEAHSFRGFYVQHHRSPNHRLLANWLAKWALRRSEETQKHASSRSPAGAPSTARAGRNSRAVDPPDPTSNGRYAHLITSFPGDE